MIKLLVIYALVVNLLAFILYGADKVMARQRRHRISEATLLGIAIIGGSIGAFLGIHIFHHKTRYWYFRQGVPMIFVIQVLLAWFIICR